MWTAAGEDMQIGDLIYDNYYGIGIIIGMDPITLDYTVDFTEAGKRGILDVVSMRQVEKICK